MTLKPQTLERLNELLTELRSGHGSPVDYVCPVLWESGVNWDIAIQAIERGEPKAFFEFFAHYQTATLDECVAAVRDVDYDFLASMLAYEGRGLEHWSGGYSSDVNNFFIAGLERLVALNQCQVSNRELDTREQTASRKVREVGYD